MNQKSEIDQYRAIYQQKVNEAKQSQEAYNNYKMETTLLVKTINEKLSKSNLGLPLLPDDFDEFVQHPEKVMELHQKLLVLKQTNEQAIRQGLGLDEGTSSDFVQSTTQPTQQPQPTQQQQPVLDGSILGKGFKPSI